MDILVDPLSVSIVPVVKITIMFCLFVTHENQQINKQKNALEGMYLDRYRR